MIVVDANLLLYAYDADSPRHAAARQWLETVLREPDPVRLGWVTIMAFLRIATHHRVYQRPLTNAAALAIVASWLALPQVDTLEPGPRHLTILRDLCVHGQCVGPLMMDAHLAALAIEHGAVLHTTDRDFARFRGLRIADPLDRSS